MEEKGVHQIDFVKALNEIDYLMIDGSMLGRSRPPRKNESYFNLLRLQNIL